MINLSEFKVDKTILLFSILREYMRNSAYYLEAPSPNNVGLIGKSISTYLYDLNISMSKKLFLIIQIYIK